MVVLPASLSAVGPLALLLFPAAAFVVFGAAVVDVVAPVLVGVAVFVGLLSPPGSVSVPVVSSRLVVRGGQRRVRRRLGLVLQAELVMVVVVSSQQGPVSRFDNQGPVQVGLHVRADVEDGGQAHPLPWLHLAVQSLTAGPVLPPQLVGPLLPHRHRLHGLLLLLTAGGRHKQIKTTGMDPTLKPL